MNNNKKKLLQEQAIYIVSVLLTALMLYYNQYSKPLIVLSLGLMILWGIEGNYFNRKKVKYIYGLWVIQYGVILGICGQEVTGMSILLLLVMMGSIVINYPFKIGVAVTVIQWMGYSLMMRIRYGEQYNAYPFFMTTMNFIIVYCLVSAIRYQMLQRKRAQEVARELEQKTVALKRAYEKLQVFYEDEKEVALLKERNRIAGEIHDTVGHRLTTAIVQIEATKRLMDVDKDKALEKLMVAQSQVREGLQDIREAVRAMKSDRKIPSLQEALTVFIDEVAYNNDIVIDTHIEALPTLNDAIENVLLRGLQEGITNGIRHGKSKWFKIVIEHKGNKIQLSIEDRGEGNEHIVFGFGLYNMERKIKELNGQLSIRSRKGEGTMLLIQLPLKEEQV